MLRLIGYFFGIGTVLALVAAAGVGIYINEVSKDLPDYEVLANYEPPVTTRLHAADGALMAEFARERRLYLPIQAVPDRVKAGVSLGRGQEFLQPSRVSTVSASCARSGRTSRISAPVAAPSAPRPLPSRSPKNFLLDSSVTYDRKVARDDSLLQDRERLFQGPHP